MNAGQHFNQNALLTTSASKSVQLKIVPPSDIEKLSYEEKNSLLKREQSPHLTIYKPQLTSMLSISHRISGKLPAQMYSRFRCLMTFSSYKKKLCAIFLKGSSCYLHLNSC